MPPRIPKACRVRGCRHTTTDPSGYCESHKSEGWKQYKPRQSRHQRGYGSKWDSTRLPAPTTSAVMQNAAVGQSTTPAQSSGWPAVTHPVLNNAPAVKNTVDLPTWEELTDIRDTLNTAIDKELSRTTSDALFLALRRVKADLNADINTRLEQSARIIQRTPDEVLPALVLAATWFDNAARDADIIRRNAITHPGFVPVIPLKVPVQ
ncbi:hypothetical protein IT040_004586 [Escherichia coli]|nr:hypothetical protein [Escherichia coli]EHA0987900.1 hypothetical protein [Escherichia coli]